MKELGREVTGKERDRALVEDASNRECGPVLEMYGAHHIWRQAWNEVGAGSLRKGYYEIQTLDATRFLVLHYASKAQVLRRVGNLL